MAEGRKQQIRVSRSAFSKVMVKSTLKSVGLVVLVLLAVYACFAATLLRAVPTTSGAGIVPVKNMTYEGGIVPAGAVVLVDTKHSTGDGIVDNLKNSFVPSSTDAVVEVVSGPYGKLAWAEPDILTVDGTMLPVSAKKHSDGSNVLTKRDQYLNNEYVVVCQSGACSYKGEVLIIPRDHIVGTKIF